MSRSRSSRKTPRTPTTPPAASPRGLWWRAALIALAGILTYWNSLSGAFILDDQSTIVENLQIRELWNPAKIFAPEQDTAIAGRPLVNLSFAINHAVAGLAVRGYHIGNIAIHIVCALVAFGIVRRTIVDSGIHVGAGSDSAQISTLDPWLIIYYMVTGKNSSGTLINAGQQLTRMEALRLYTAENGWFFREEDKLGTIQPGKFGDIVVLSDDYFDPAKVPDEAIKRVRSVLTIIDGKVVHDNLR